MLLVLPGVQQKYIIVTCNYVARQQGLTKLMSVADAKEKCPQLVLVNGEDLTHYREMSYKVTGTVDDNATLQPQIKLHFVVFTFPTLVISNHQIAVQL